MCPWLRTALPWSQFQGGSALTVVTGLQEGYCRPTFTVVLYTVPALQWNYRYLMEHHRQHEDIESAKCKQDKKTQPPTLIFSQSRWRFSILISGYVVSFLVVFFFVSGHAHSSACAPCYSNNTHCICWGITILDQIPKGKHASPREASAGGSHWSCPWCWTQFSASFGSWSMAQLESHYVKPQDFLYPCSLHTALQQNGRKRCPPCSTHYVLFLSSNCSK